jgi:3-oxoacyl-[acyl-carrier-protein] synthase II
MNRRVVITGAGVVSALGTGVETFWNSIKEGKSGVGLVQGFDVSQLNSKVGAEIADFEVSKYIDRKEAKRMDKYAQYAMAASQLAVEDSKIDIDKLDKDRFGVVIGSGIGGLGTFHAQTDILREKGPTRVSPFFIPMLIANMAAGLVAIKYGARGYSDCNVTACASGTNSIGNAFKAIQRSDADVMIVGGAEAPLVQVAFAGFCSMKAMSQNPDPKTASRPFDANRDGFVMGEGAGVVILEELSHAKARNANIIAELVGFGSTNDAYHMTAPSPDGIGQSQCMKKAINDAGINPNQVGYINAHGTSTPHNDRNETKSIKEVFGQHAYDDLKVSSTKSMTGHLLGASGGIEAIITALALKEGYIPPTINLETPDEDCDLDYVPNKGIHKDIKYALSNSFGFGGINAAILLKKYEDD